MLEAESKYDFTKHADLLWGGLIGDKYDGGSVCTWIWSDSYLNSIKHFQYCGAESIPKLSDQPSSPAPPPTPLPVTSFCPISALEVTGGSGHVLDRAQQVMQPCSLSPSSSQRAELAVWFFTLNKTWFRKENSIPVPGLCVLFTLFI